MANNPYNLAGTAVTAADWTTGSTRVEVRRNVGASAVWMRITRNSAAHLVGTISIENLNTGELFSGVPLDSVGAANGDSNDLGVLWFLPAGGTGMQFCSAYVKLTARGQKVQFTVNDDAGGHLDQTIQFDA